MIRGGRSPASRTRLSILSIIRRDSSGLRRNVKPCSMPSGRLNCSCQSNDGRPPQSQIDVFRLQVWCGIRSPAHLEKPEAIASVIAMQLGTSTQVLLGGMA